MWKAKDGAGSFVPTGFDRTNGQKVEELSPKTVENYSKRLHAKLQEVLQNNALDEQRIITEVAIFAEKIAVAEETVRLGSHVHQFRQILASNEPVGRKLDFLVQEFNREANTIGSKAQDLEIARVVVDLKSEIEKSANRFRTSSRCTGELL